MKKKVISALLSAAMVATLLVGCGGSDAAAPAADAAATETTEATAEATTEAAAEESADLSAVEDGKLLNIYCWNEEFKTRVENLYPGYEIVDATTGKIGDVTVKFNITPNDNNAYQNNLDATLLEQENAAANDKVDLFLVEADYALKYVDTEYAMPLSELGITDADVSKQYKYTKDVMTDSEGVLKGVSWQGCPAGLIYRRDIAKEVLGADDPDTVQAAVKDWDTFAATAKKLAENGYNITSTVNDTYRVFSNNVTSKWVEDGKINIDPNLMKWVDMSKEMVDAKETDTYDLWSDDWAKGFFEDSNVFCYFGPAWFFNFSMHCDEEGSVGKNGGWGLCVGPQAHFWGGTWICGAAGTDNADLVKDIMLKMTTDDEVMTAIVDTYQDFVNNSTVMEAKAADDACTVDFLGGQNPNGIFCDGVKTIDLSNITGYDQGCNEAFQLAMKDYFEGNAASVDEALENFYKAVEEKYPELSH